MIFAAPRQQSSLRRTLLFLLLLFTVVYLSLFLQNIPYEQGEGVTAGWKVSTQTSWTSFLCYLFNPITVQRMADGDHLINVRVTESVIQKLLYSLFGDHVEVYKFYTILLGAIFVWFLHRFTFYLTKNSWSSLLLPLFLLTTPAYGWTFMEYGDYAPLDQIMLIIYFLYFFHCLKDLIVLKKFELNRLGKWMGLWLLGMITVRAKEPNVFLVPAVSWGIYGFSCIKEYCSGHAWNRHKSNLWNALGIVFALMLLSLPVVLTRNSSSNGASALCWNCPIKMFLFNPQGYEKENIPCLFTLKDFLPVSVMSNFGFFLSWAFIFAVAFLIYKKFSTIQNKIASIPDFNLSICFLLLWLGISIAFYFVFSSDTFFRYIVWALLPFALLVTIVFVQVLNLVHLKIKRILVILLIAFLGLRTVQNIQHSLFLHMQLERIWVAKWTFFETMYRAEKGEKPKGLFDLYDFAYQTPYSPTSLEPYLYPEESKEDLLREEKIRPLLSQHKRLYVASNRPLSLPDEFQMKEILQFDINKNSLLTHLKTGFRKKPPRQYYLYQISL